MVVLKLQQTLRDPVQTENKCQLHHLRVSSTLPQQNYICRCTHSNIIEVRKNMNNNNNNNAVSRSHSCTVLMDNGQKRCYSQKTVSSVLWPESGRALRGIVPCRSPHCGNCYYILNDGPAINYWPPSQPHFGSSHWTLTSSCINGETSLLVLVSNLCPWLKNSVASRYQTFITLLQT